MLNFFRTNQAIGNFALLIILVVFQLPTVINGFPEVQGSPAGIFDAFFTNLAVTKPTLVWVPSTLLVWIQAFIINQMLQQTRTSKEVNLFGGLFLITFSVSSPHGFLALDYHIANTILLLLINTLFRLGRGGSAAGSIFNLGLWAGLAGLFQTTYLIVFFLALIGLNTIRTGKNRERIMALFGLITPFLLEYTYLFWLDQTDLFWSQFKITLIPLLDFKNYPFLPDQIALILGGLYLVPVLLASNQIRIKRNINSQKRITLLFNGMLLAGLTLFLKPQIGIEHILILSIFISILFAEWIADIRNRWASLYFFVILIFIFAIQFYPIIV